MTACSLSLRYTLAPEDGASGAERPRFAIEPDASDAHQVRFTATHLRSVDRLDVKWSSVDRMKEDPVKAYLSKIGAKGRAANTPAQRDAARANGKRGGRPAGSKDSKPRTRRKNP
jgi:hypothetical protein